MSESRRTLLAMVLTSLAIDARDLRRGREAVIADILASTCAG